MELVERYIYAVVKHLPAKSRKDIENELRSIIMDALDERTKGNTPEERDVYAVLEELGAPSKVARNYFKEGSYVIGPRFYELYLLILKITLGATFLGITVALIVEAFEKGVVVTDIFRWPGQLFSAMLSSVGLVTIAFAITERVNPDFGKNAPEFENCWSPKDLPEVPRPYEKVKISELVVSLIFTAIFFVIINFYPETLALIHVKGQGILSLINLDLFSRYLPYINILLAITFIKIFLLLVDGRYKAYTFILEIADTLGVVILALVIISGPTMLDIPGAAGDNILFKIINGIYYSTLTGIIAVGLFELARHSYRFVRAIRK